MNKQSVAIVVPTLNAGEAWQSWIDAVKSQEPEVDRVLVIDSDSDDDTVQMALDAGFEVMRIRRSDFGHGSSRQTCVEYLNNYSILVFLTQDAILKDSDSIRNLIRCFDESDVGAVYGRQLPRKNATIVEAHARLFNYPESSYTRTLADSDIYGIKTIFISNSYAAYQREILQHVGGFPGDTILGEDTYVVARMLLEGYKVRYCANALVYHSHDYSMIEEFKRYFDTGVFHAGESWLIDKFGHAEGNGKDFVLSELKFVLQNKPALTLAVIVRTIFRYAGYRCGKLEKYLPVWVKRKLSMHSYYWKKSNNQD